MSSGFIVAIVIFYLAILINPSFLFANNYQYKNFQVYSDQTISENIDNVIDDAIKRLQQTELFDQTDKLQVYICNDHWRFKFFTRNGNAGGVVNFLFSPNIFIRESNIDKNEIVPPGGWMYTPKERPLSYFIAHEAVHSLQRKYNPFLQLTTPSYILEGYADYIAKKPDFNYDAYKKMYLENDFVMNPKNGQYHKYHFYISYLIDKKGYDFERIVEEEPDLEGVLKLAVI